MPTATRRSVNLEIPARLCDRGSDFAIASPARDTDVNLIRLVSHLG